MADIDRLVEELHATFPAGQAGTEADGASGEAIRLITWLEHVRASDGVDLLLVSGAPASVRVDGARQHVRKNALQHLHQEITITRRHGSFTLEESLARLVKDGLVERDEAQARAVHPDDFESALAGPSTTLGPP